MVLRQCMYSSGTYVDTYKRRPSGARGVDRSLFRRCATTVPLPRRRFEIPPRSVVERWWRGGGDGDGGGGGGGGGGGVVVDDGGGGGGGGCATVTARGAVEVVTIRRWSKVSAVVVSVVNGGVAWNEAPPVRTALVPRSYVS